MPVSPELGAGVKEWERKGVAGMRSILACSQHCQAMCITNVPKVTERMNSKKGLMRFYTCALNQSLAQVRASPSS